MSYDNTYSIFSGGEGSPRLDGRVDLEWYYTGCRTLINMICTRYGPAERRPGLKYVTKVKDSTKATRLMPFKYSTVQAYVLEVGDEYIRFFKDRGKILHGVGTEDISALGNIVGHWLLNETEGTNVADDDGGTHDGTSSVDTATLTEEGKVGTGCYDLDGQYDVEIADHNDFSFTNNSNDSAFSMVCWGFVTQQANVQVLLSKWSDENATREWRLSLSADRKLQLHLVDTGADLSAGVVGQWKLNDDAADTNLISSLPQYTIDDADAGANTFKISDDGDLTSSFPDGSEFTVEGSTANDGQYVVVGTAYSAPDFTITVASVTDGTDDGTVAPHAGVATANTEEFNDTGKINGALDFGAAQAIEIDDSADFSFGDGSNDSAFSISAWVYVTNTALTQSILSKYNTVLGADVREWIFYISATGKLRLQLIDESADAGQRISSQDSLSTGWHYVVGTYDGSGGDDATDGMNLYVDGVSVDVDVQDIGTYVAMENLATKVAIGASYIEGSLDNYFADKIDNVILFDIELTPANVAALWNDGNGTETVAAAEVFAVTVDALTLGWHFLACTYSAPADESTAAAGIILYVDGVAVDITATEDASYTAMQGGAEEIRIGSQRNSGDSANENFWGDKIDEISIFSDVLTPTEIASLFSTTPYEITSPYVEADLFEVQYIQSADVIYNFHSSYNIRKLSRFEHNLWEMESIDFDWPPFMTENVTDTTITPSAKVGTIELTASASIFTADQVGSYFLIKHNRTNNKQEKTLTDIATLVVLGDAADSYAVEGHTDILVDVEGSFRLRTSGIWTGTVVFERSYDKQLILVLDAAPAGGAWSAGDVITGGTSGDTCVVTKAIDTTHYNIKQLTGSFTDGEILTAQDSNARDCAATWPRYEGWHTIEPFVSTQDQNFNAAGEDSLGDAYLRARRIVDSAGNDPTVIISCERYYHYGIVKITGYISSTSVTAEVIRTLGSTSATALWSEGAWSDESGYPSCGTFHEERLMVAGTVAEPHRLDGSVTDKWENFKGGTLDNDATHHSLAANEMNAVRWLISKEVLLLGTAGAEWKLGSFDADEPLSPGNPIKPRQQTTYGSKKIQAIMIANVVLFVVGDQSESAPGRIVRGAQYIFDRGESGGYDAPDYTTFAEHITESGIVSMAYQQLPEPVLWCVLDNGKLIGMTFEPGQKVWGWFNVVTEGLFEDVAVIPGVNEDEVWVIVKRTLPDGSINKCIEYFMPRDWGADQKDCFFVDSGLTFDGGDAVTVTNVTQADPAVVTMDTYPTDGDGNNLADGDQVRIRYVGGMDELRGIVYTISNPNTTNKTFELRDKLDAVDIDSTGFDPFVGTISGDLTYDSKDVKNVSAADIAAISAGAPVTGTGIPDDTTIEEVKDGWFKMSAKATKAGTSVTITIAGNVEKVSNSFTGMGHLEGKTVSVLGDGSVHADVVVVSGGITLTEYYNKVHAGLRYKSDLMPMKPEVAGKPGALRPKTKKINQIIFSFQNTLGCTYGTLDKDGNPAITETILFREISDKAGLPVPLFTGEKIVGGSGGYELEGNIFVRQDQPLPLTLRSLTTRMNVHG